MQDRAEKIAKQLADIGFFARVKLAYDWAFHATEDEGERTRQMLGMAEEAAWEGDHPREIIANMELPGGYVVDAFAFDPKSIEEVAFVGIRPDGSEVELTLDQVDALGARYGLSV